MTYPREQAQVTDEEGGQGRRQRGLKGRLRLDRVGPDALRNSAGGQALSKMSRGMKSLARPSVAAGQVGP